MLLEFRHVTGKKGWHTKKSRFFGLQDISFSLEGGYLLGIAGKNGAGKTTLFRYIMEPDIRYDGEILLEGEDIRKDRVKTLNRIGFVSDENEFFHKYTIGQNAELLGRFYDHWDQEKFETLIKHMDLGMGMKVDALSRGQWIRFQTAFAASHTPKLYLFDEPTAGMDPIFRKEFFRLLQELLMDGKSSAIMTTHIEEEMEWRMDWKAVLEQGRLLSFGEAIP